MNSALLQEKFTVKYQKSLKCQPLSGNSVCSEPVARTGEGRRDMTHSQSDWTHPLKTQQLSGTLWEIWCHLTWIACSSLSPLGPIEASFTAALGCKTCLQPRLIQQNSVMTSASAAVNACRSSKGKSNALPQRAAGISKEALMQGRNAGAYF